MSIFDFFFPKPPASAALAKERLQLVLAHERSTRDAPDFLPRMQKELLAVVARYLPISDEMIQIRLGKTGPASVLEIDVEVPRQTRTPRLAARA